MKKYIVILALALFSTASFAAPFVNKADVQVAANATQRFDVVLPGKTVSKIKICLAFNSPKKSLELNGDLRATETGSSWFGTTFKGCTVLEDIGTVATPEGSFVKLQLRNFNDTPTVGHVVVVVYE